MAIEGHVNPFLEAIQRPPLPEKDPDQEEHPKFFAKLHEAQNEYRKKAANSLERRQEMLERGIIKVVDLDDEELRLGRCRGADGKIPRASSKTVLSPELYEAMVREHFQRTNEKLRSQMDIALGTLVEIMVDDTVEPRDRAEAAKYLYERVAGKTPDRVQVAVTQAPWEEVVQGIARISRAESKQLRGQTIDAEVVDDDVRLQPDHDYDGASQGDSDGNGHWSGVDGAAGDNGVGVHVDPVAPPIVEEERPSPIEALGIHDSEAFGDLRIAPATPVPGYADPESTSATMPATLPPLSNSEVLRQKAEAEAELAARRKAARKRIQAAKKNRAVARAMGRDALQSNKIQASEADGKIKFTVSE